MSVTCGRYTVMSVTIMSVTLTVQASNRRQRLLQARSCQSQAGIRPGAAAAAADLYRNGPLLWVTRHCAAG
jgi:hypothetical protein